MVFLMEKKLKSPFTPHHLSFLVKYEFGNVGFSGERKTGDPAEKPWAINIEKRLRVRSTVIYSHTFAKTDYPIRNQG